MTSILDLLPSGPAMTIFITAALAIGASPGPGMLYGVARSLSQGKEAAFLSVLGLSMGSFINCLAAAFGLAALISVSPLAYDMIRYIGAAYMIYLAWRNWQSNPHLEAKSGRNMDRVTIIRQAIVTNVLNPKSGLFYLAFVPQFTDPERGSVFAQFIILGLIFNVMGNLINLIIALTFGQIGDWLNKHPRVWTGQKFVTSTILAGLAGHLVFFSGRS